MHTSTLLVLVFVEVVTLLLFLPLRRHLLRKTGLLEQGRVSESILSQKDYDIESSLQLIHFIYKVFTPIMIVFIVTPVSGILYAILGAPVVIVLSPLVIYTAISYFSIDLYNEAYSKVDCAHYHLHRASTTPQSYPIHPPLTTQNLYHHQIFNTNPDAIANRTHIH